MQKHPLLSGSSEEMLLPFWQLLPMVNNLVTKCFLPRQFPKAVTSVCFLLFSPYWEQGGGPPSNLGKVPPHV